MNPARAIRNDTNPPPETSLRTFSRDDWYVPAETVVADTIQVPDWGKLDAYLPQGSFACTATVAPNYNRHLLSAQSAVDQLVSKVDLLHFEGAKNLTILIEEARKTTEAGLLSLIVYDKVHSDIKAANLLLAAPHHGLLVEADLLDGYEQYQTANWDRHDAEAITAQTLAYARRLMKVMPTKLGPPDVAPTGDGSIALEWVPDDHTHKLDKLFLDIGPGEVWRAYWTLRTGEFGRLPQVGFSDQTQTILNNLFNDLST